MSASYHITPQGLMYAIASTQVDAARQLLVHILKHYGDASISLAEIRSCCQGDKQIAFRLICDMLNQQFIDIDEQFSAAEPLHETAANMHFSDIQMDADFVLSDLNGLPIKYTGFDQFQALQLAAVAGDFIQVSQRSRQMNQSGNLLTPVFLETIWQDRAVVIYLLQLECFSCLLTTVNSAALEQQSFIRFISFLCNRYEHEQHSR